MTPQPCPQRVWEGGLRTSDLTDKVGGGALELLGAHFQEVVDVCFKIAKPPSLELKGSRSKRWKKPQESSVLLVQWQEGDPRTPPRAPWDRTPNSEGLCHPPPRLLSNENWRLRDAWL